MSRGPGVIERAVEAAFASNPSGTFTVEELAVLAYPGLNRVEKKHRVAVIRAADKVATRCGWQGWKVYRPTHPRLYLNPYDLRSYAIGRMRADFLDGVKSVSEIERELDTPAPSDHRSHWRLIQPGEAWWQHVEINKASRDGRSDDADAMRAALGASIGIEAKKLGLG